ncbi:MAG: ABC transporter permease [Thiomonas sp.]
MARTVRRLSRVAGLGTHDTRQAPGARVALSAQRAPIAVAAALAVLAVVGLLVFSALGFWELLRTAFQSATGAWSLHPLQQALTQRYMILGPLLNSLLLAVPVALAATVLGGLLAWLATRTDLPGGAWLLPLVALPHVIPGFQLASAWVEIFSHGGLWHAALGLQAPLSAYGYAAIVVVMTLHLMLFPYLLVASNLQAADPALEEAGRIAGLAPMKVFVRITMPLARPALLGSLLLVFAYVMEEFGIPSLLGTPSGFDTLTTRIYGLATTPPLDLSGASVLALGLGLIALGVLWMQLRLLAGSRLETLAGKASRQSRVRLGSWRWPLAALVWAALLAVALAPFAALILVSLLDSWGQGYGPSHWTGLRYAELLRSEELRRAVRNTLSLALGSAVVGTAIAVVIAYAAQRFRQRLVGRLALLADRVSFVAFAVPGLVIGLALILAFSGGWLPLYGTQWILLVAYTLRFSGVGVRTVAARLSQIGIELEAAGQVAGLCRLRILSNIVLPLLGPALVGSAVLIFVNAVKEISATSLLASQGSETLAYEAYVRFQEGNYTQGSAVSVVMIVLVIAVLLAGRLLGRSRPTGTTT